MLRVEHLSVNYKHVVALQDVSIRVEEGQIVSVIGSNGAGKTSLLNAISGAVKYQKGRSFLGIRLFRPSRIKSFRLELCRCRRAERFLPG